MRHSGNTVSLSAPQPHFPESCRIAAGLHSAGFLNALGFDFDISDPPLLLQNKRETVLGGLDKKNERKVKEKGKTHVEQRESKKHVLVRGSERERDRSTE